MNGTLRLIPRPFRRRGLWVVMTLVVRACLNLVGLAVLLPPLALLLDPAALEGSDPLARLYAASGLGTPRAFAAAVCAGVVVLVALKCLLNLLLARVERRYIYDLYRNLSRRLYIAYHDRGLPFIKAHHSSVLARNVNVVCLQFTAGVLKPAAGLAVDALLLLLIFGALLACAPAAALLAVAVFIPSVGLYYLLVRHRIEGFGVSENSTQREKARLVAETFRGYADIELGGAFPRMLRLFDRAMDEVIRTRSREADLGQLPQILTETGLAAGVALLAAIASGAEPERARMLFGVFAVAALRLLPSVRNLMSGWAKIRYNRCSAAVLRDALADVEAAPSAPTTSSARAASGGGMPFEHGIEVRGLTFRFPDSDTPLFRDLDLTIRKGEHVGIRGRSGAGKSTLFNLLLGLYEPAAGAILIDGVPLTPANRRAWQRHAGYVSQHLFLIDGTVAENVALGTPPEAIDRERVAEAIEAAQLGPFVASLPRGVDTPVGECGCRLSGGQRQRLGIARALYRRADVLFFDEATSALDTRTEADINHAIASLAARRPGLTLLVIAHRESSLAACDRIIDLDP